MDFFIFIRSCEIGMNRSYECYFIMMLCIINDHMRLEFPSTTISLSVTIVFDIKQGFYLMTRLMNIK